MGRDGGVEVSHQAVNNAKADLEEVLKLLNPGWDKGTETPAFPEGGAVRQLSHDSEAVGGFWPAAQGYHTSFRNADLAVSGAYLEITLQLEHAITLLKTAVTNLENAEGAGAAHAGQAQV
ncbi:hypothetical protein ACFQVD_40025 [Streptosporangium amethystogenes subsp. fukuiense]|uniref:PE domain-containing protein n=1 Tax=Streptosporangium amethystogenes subsp. fukuiense TaxID=698418 RepID=A0ABW2TDE1_9ACTN